MDAALFRSQTHEFDISEVPVTGTVPGWLSGELFRNGPAIFEQGPDRMRHFFDGYAMLHRFSIHNGAVAYKNRILKSSEYINDTKLGRIAGNEWGTAAWYSGSFVDRFMSVLHPAVIDNTNVNLITIAGKYLSISDFSTMVEFDPGNLETRGVVHFTDIFGNALMGSAAHPSVDPITGDIFNALTRFGPDGNINVFRISPDAVDKRELVATIPLKERTYFHSFALTPGYFVFIEQPFDLSLSRLIAGQLRGKSLAECYEWQPERGTKFRAVNRKDGTVTTLETSAFFVFHTVNAFEEDGKIVIDLAGYSDPGIVTEFFFDHLLKSGLGRKSAANLLRFTLDLNNRRVGSQVICGEETFELPRINRNVAGKPYQYAYGLGMPDSPGADFFTRILKIDVNQGTSISWHETEAYPGEPVFVARPGGTGEDDGCILSFVFDGRTKTSFLLILDAKTLDELARAVLPHHVPFGLHGIFVERS